MPPSPIYTFPGRLTDSTKALGFVEQPLAIDLQGDFTISARVKKGDQIMDGHSAFLSLESPQVDSSIVWLGFMWNKSAGVRFLGRNQNNAFPEFGGSTDLGPASASDAISSNWTHVAFTVSTSSKTSAIFVDGKKDATLQLSAALKSASNVSVVLGRGFWEGQNCDAWGGQIENVKIWQAVLTDPEIFHEASIAPLHPLPPISAIHISNEPSQRSVNANISTTIVWYNARPNKIVTYWLNYEGKRVEYATIEPGRSLEQQTFVTHPWLVVEKGSGEQEDRDWGIWHPMEYKAKIVVS